MQGFHVRLLLLREQNPTRQIRELLDINESKPPDARLPISAFDLDRESRRRRIEEARLEREEVRRSIEEECAQREQTVSYLREILWDPLLVKPCTLRSISGDTMVRNYSLVAVGKTNDVRVWDRLSADADEFSYRYLWQFNIFKKLKFFEVELKADQNGFYRNVEYRASHVRTENLILQL